MPQVLLNILLGLFLLGNGLAQGYKPPEVARPAFDLKKIGLIEVERQKFASSLAGYVVNEVKVSENAHKAELARRLIGLALHLDKRNRIALVASHQFNRGLEPKKIATDYKPLIITMLSVADGVGIVTENLYPGRFRYVEELQRLGADVSTTGHHAVIRGVPRLSGAEVKAHDIRAGAAMVVAGLAAEGETIISGVHHIDRGYDDLVGRLSAVGASIERISG